MFMTSLNIFTTKNVFTSYTLVLYGISALDASRPAINVYSIVENVVKQRREPILNACDIIL